jgi:hypothetical protein
VFLFLRFGGMVLLAVFWRDDGFFIECWLVWCPAGGFFQLKASQVGDRHFLISGHSFPNHRSGVFKLSGSFFLCDPELFRQCLYEFLGIQG